MTGSGTPAFPLEQVPVRDSARGSPASKTCLASYSDSATSLAGGPEGDRDRDEAPI
jgi:hypothetical protein